jgi:hypothetical protein
MRRFPAPFTALLRERVVCGSLLLAGAVLVLGNMMGLHLWHCAFLEVTGRPCPGCGLTRGMTALCHGEVALSMKLHPFSPLFALGGMIMIAAMVLPPPSRERLIDGVQTVETRTGLSALILLALLAFGLWRIFTGRMPGE